MALRMEGFSNIFSVVYLHMKTGTLSQESVKKNFS